MGFTEPQFLFLLVPAAVVGRVCPSRYRTGLLLVFSYLFYITWLPRGAVLMAALTLLAFAAVRGVEHARKRGEPNAGRAGVAVAILLTVCLCSFKIALLTPDRGIAGMVMPLGISYYTFKLISYVLDVQRGKIPACSSLVYFAALGLLGVAVAVYCRRPGWQMSNAQWTTEIALVSLATLWVSPVLWSYHPTAVLPALAVVLARTAARPRLGWTIILGWLIAMGLLGCPLACALGEIFWATLLLGGLLVWTARLGMEKLYQGR